MNLRIFILRLLIPVQKVMQLIGNPEPKIQSRFVQRVVDQIQDGDLLLSRENWRLTNPFVPGYWGHAATYYQGNVIEAVGTGVRSVNIYQWLYQKDSVALLRASLLTEEVRAQIGILAKSQVGKKYDFIFKPHNAQWFCSELWIWGHNKVAPRHIKPDGTPQDLYDTATLEILDESKN
jgi:uncharacterized protein YycO